MMADDYPQSHIYSQTLFYTEGMGLGHGHRAVCSRHCGVGTNHSATFSHMLPEVCD